MQAEQAARTASGRGADRDRAGYGTAAGAPPRLVLIVNPSRCCIPRVEGAAPGAAERAAFVTALHVAATVPAARTGPPALVGRAVRADYLGRLIADPR